MRGTTKIEQFSEMYVVLGFSLPPLLAKLDVLLELLLICKGLLF
jgi:hypothetical protein